MALTTVVKGVIEAWWADISSLVSPQDGSGNTALGPVRAQITASIPVTGSVQKGTAGAAAPDQTLKQFHAADGGLSIASGATAALYTVTAGKTFYVTDIQITANTATQFEAKLQAAGTTQWNSNVKGDTAPIDLPGIETQPQFAGGQAVTLVFPATSATNAWYYIAGYEQ
jgi:hypothetical protein